MKANESSTKKEKLTIEELCKKYDNLMPIKKDKKIPMLGVANCTK